MKLGPERLVVTAASRLPPHEPAQRHQKHFYRMSQNSPTFTLFAPNNSLTRYSILI
jgi:hypothetical protein